MEIFIFVWKTSKQAMTDNKNQNLHSNESFFLIKKHNLHSSSLQENWARSKFGGFRPWGLGVFFFRSTIHQHPLKFLLLSGRNFAPIIIMKPSHFIFLQDFPQSEWNGQGSPSAGNSTRLPGWILHQVVLWGLQFAFGAAERTQAVSEPPFPTAHTFLNNLSLCICGGSGELCLCTRTSAW